MKKTVLALLTSFFLTGTTSPVLAMWAPVDDDGNEQGRQAIIQQQLEELEPFGVELKDNRLNVSLKEDNQVALGITLSRSPELLAHYDVHLNYLAPLSQDHLPLFGVVPKLVSLKIHNQSLDANKASILEQILNQHRPTLSTLDFGGEQGFRLTDDGLITIQQSLSVLPCLKVLQFKGQNSLSHNGFIPLSNILSNIVSLEELNLSAMNLGSTGESQALNQLSKLTNLTKIDVSNNKLGGDFLAGLKPLPNLIELNVSCNQITGKKLRAFPKFKSKKRLKILDISHNQIDDEGISNISRLPKLVNLNVSNNNITDEVINEITELENLTFLDIFDNKISRNGIRVLAQNQQIQIAREQALISAIERAEIEADLAGTGWSVEMTILSLSEKQLTTASPKIRHLTNLTYLSFFRNRLTSLPIEFNCLTNLKTLCVEENQFTVLPTAICSLIGLEILLIHSNQLTTLPCGISRLTSLKQLSLQRNPLTSLPVEFCNLTGLTELNFWGNRLTALPFEFGRLTGLTSLDLQGNQLTSLPREFSRLTNLYNLYLQRNSFYSRPIECIAQNARHVVW